MTGIELCFILLAIGSVLALLLIYLLVSGGLGRQQSSVNQKGSANQPKFSVAKKEVAKEQAPSGFPADIPIEAGAKIVQNYQADTTDGRHQATRVFESAKTVKQNYQLYLDWLTKNGWEVKTKSAADIVASIYAVKSGSQLTATISKNTVTGVVTVGLSVVAKK